jgi:hypothetical protein
MLGFIITRFQEGRNKRRKGMARHREKQGKEAENVIGDSIIGEKLQFA